MKTETVGNGLLKKIYGKRSDWSHKGNYGRLLIIAGSKRHTGSAVFNAVSAARSGCDLVTVAAPERAANVAASFSPSLMTEPLKGDYINETHIETLLELAKENDAIVIGCGIGGREETRNAVIEVIRKTEKPIVVDADAIRLVGTLKEERKKLFIGKKAVLTPHKDEFLALCGKKVNDDEKSRIDAVRKEAEKMNCTILLKGHVDVVSDGKKTALNRTGNAFMTKGGFGDTLAGICGSLLAQKINPFDSACASAYINGKAGEITSKERKLGVMAEDIFECIPKVIDNI